MFCFPLFCCVSFFVFPFFGCVFYFFSLFPFLSLCFLSSAASYMHMLLRHYGACMCIHHPSHACTSSFTCEYIILPVYVQTPPHTQSHTYIHNHPPTHTSSPKHTGVAPAHLVAAVPLHVAPLAAAPVAAPPVKGTLADAPLMVGIGGAHLHARANPHHEGAAANRLIGVAPMEAVKVVVVASRHHAPGGGVVEVGGERKRG